MGIRRKVVQNTGDVVVEHAQDMLSRKISDNYLLFILHPDIYV